MSAFQPRAPSGGAWHTPEIDRRAIASHYRLWLLYLAGSAVAFEEGTAQLYQTLAVKHRAARPVLPETRADLYPSSAAARPLTPRVAVV